MAWMARLFSMNGNCPPQRAHDVQLLLPRGGALAAQAGAAQFWCAAALAAMPAFCGTAAPIMGQLLRPSLPTAVMPAPFRT